MWKSQIALRHVLGDPWPSMSLEARGLNDVDDRVTLVAAMNEISRLGRDNLTRTNEAHREVTEQVLISAVTSAEALSRIIQRSQMNSSERYSHALRLVSLPLLNLCSLACSHRLEIA
mmetsp:Transcript_12952/g.45533  ORF Transcript_12952/g.45533 Transcript_12952/m.45533 type:complete len:117 (+) Transcript_12952:78-428(+)